MDKGLNLSMIALIEGTNILKCYLKGMNNNTLTDVLKLNYQLVLFIHLLQKYSLVLHLHGLLPYFKVQLIHLLFAIYI